MKNLYPPDIAKEFIEKYFTDCPVVILTGSSKNAPILVSDIDLIIFSPSVGQAVHDIYMEEDIVFDVMICPLYAYESMFLHCVNNVLDGTVLTMIVTGVILIDKEKLADEIMKQAWVYYYMGYRGLLPEKLTVLSNTITRRLEFLGKRLDGLDKCLLAYDILDNFLQLYLWYHIGWSRTGKQRASVLYEVSATLHDQLYDSLKKGITTNNFNQFSALVTQEYVCLINEQTQNPKHLHDAVSSSPNRIIFAVSVRGNYFTFLKEIILPLEQLFEDSPFNYYILPQQIYYEIVFVGISASQAQTLVLVFKEHLKLQNDFIQYYQTLASTPPQAHFGGKESFALSEKTWVALINTIASQISNNGIDSINSFKHNTPYYLIGFGKGMGMNLEGFYQFCTYLFDVWVLRATDVNLNMKYQHITEQKEKVITSYENTLQKYLPQFNNLYGALINEWDENQQETAWLNPFIEHLQEIKQEFDEIKHWQIPYIKWYFAKKNYSQSQPIWLWYERTLEVCFATLNLRQQDIAFVIYIVKILISQHLSPVNEQNYLASETVIL